jgi:hypothetical protein
MPRIFIAFVCAFSLLATAAIAKEFSSVEEQMSSRDFKAAGLDKLSPEELAFLESALVRQQPPALLPAKTPPAATTTSKRPLSREKVAADFGAEQVTQPTAADSGDTLHTHIEGTVQEFSGRAAFVLANGQIWQLRTPADVFLSKKLVNPEVTLIKGSLVYKMVIDAANVVVFVKRIQ